MSPVAANRQLTDFRRIVLRGSVQGSGIRPTVARCALTHNLRGFVRNEMSGVAIRIGGDHESCDCFLKQLRSELPKEIEIFEQTESPNVIPKEFHPLDLPKPFRIESSSEQGSTRTTVPVDQVICDDCIVDLQTEGNRRFAYPFTSCTACGPRYSIMHSMPYDRGRTSMAEFEMCDACQAEYCDPGNRRFHSQTNCCPTCGPRLWASDGAGRDKIGHEDAIGAAIETLRRGQVLALKGIGGYQLICDATNHAAVTRLRVRKGRPTKPLAVMVANLPQAAALANISELERATLRSPAGPIVLLQRRSASTTPPILSSSIHPGLSDIGVMLATSPLHLILLHALGKPMVVTSGNRNGDPIEYEPQQAEQRLLDLVDRFLHHDREIVRPVDDSVIRCIAGQAVTIRAARGIAPLPLAFRSDRSVIATGGHQKVAVAICNGDQSVLGPYIGDMGSEASRQRFVDQARSLAKLYGCEPRLVSHDLQPNYFTSDYRSDLEHRGVQHHHAHLAAAMLEHGWSNRTVLGFSFDGTGMGSDGSVWGGEVLIASPQGCQRVGGLRPFPLAGGEAAIRQPMRVAIALVHAASGADAVRTLRLSDDGGSGVGLPSRDLVLQLCERPAFSPSCSSVGRLFDGVATIVMDPYHCSYEGEPAMLLEAACDQNDRKAYDFDVAAEPFCQLDWRPVIRQVLRDLDQGISVGAIAMRFHRGLAQAIVSVAEQFPDLPIILCGGVFQNRLLVELVLESSAMRRAVRFSTAIPPNDNGLAAGQLAATEVSDETGRMQCV